MSTPQTVSWLFLENAPRSSMILGVANVFKVMPTINFTGNAFVLLSFDPPAPLPELPPEGSNDNPASIIGPVVEPPGWPDLNNLYMGGFQPQNPNQVPDQFLNIPAQLPDVSNPIFSTTLPSGTPDGTGLYSNFEIAASVPEPSTTALVILGCSAAAIAKRFRKARR